MGKPIFILGLYFTDLHRKVWRYQSGRVFRNHKSKDRVQYNRQKKRDKTTHTKNGQQNTINQKLKIEQHEPHKKWGKLRFPGRVYNQVSKIRHQSPHLTFGSRSTHTCIVILFTSVDENDKKILEHLSFQDMYRYNKGRIQTAFQLGTFFTLKGWERWPKDPSKFEEKTKCSWSLTTHPLQNGASKKCQMVSNKTVGLSNYWALFMQKLPSNIQYCSDVSQYRN